MTSINNALTSLVRMPDCLRKYDTTRVQLFIPRVNRNVTSEMIQQDICTRSWGSVCSIKIHNYKNGNRIAFVVINWNTSYQRAMDDLYNLIETKANIRTFYQDNQHWSWVVNNKYINQLLEQNNGEKEQHHDTEKLDRIGWLSHAPPRTLLEYVQELERQRNEFSNNLLDIAWSREQHHFYTQEKHKGDVELLRIKSTYLLL